MVSPELMVFDRDPREWYVQILGKAEIGGVGPFSETLLREFGNPDSSENRLIGQDDRCS